MPENPEQNSLDKAAVLSNGQIVEVYTVADLTEFAAEVNNATAYRDIMALARNREISTDIKINLLHDYWMTGTETKFRELDAVNALLQPQEIKPSNYEQKQDRLLSITFYLGMTLRQHWNKIFKK